MILKKMMYLWCLAGLCLAPYAQAQQTLVEVTGKVTDAVTGEPLAGATVALKGSDGSTQTGADGKFKLSRVPADAVLLTSFVGYASHEVAVNGQTDVLIVLQPRSALDEVVVVGYGTQRRRDITGSVSSVSSEDIARQPLVSVDQLLQGKAAGVQISNASGAPGGRVNVRIRGGSSINAGNEPLFVIDGIPVYNDSKDPSGSSYGTFTPTNALASLNPNDIESMEVLKDASATAIYGSRGANGVILITTKRGAGDKVNVDYNGYYGEQQLSSPIDLMNGAEHADFLNDWAVQGGLPKPFENPNSIGVGTDWQQELFRRASIQSHQISVSSGKGNTNYFISGNYFNQEGIALNSQLERYAFRINSDSKIGDKLRLGQSLTFSRTYNKAVPSTSAGAGNIRSVADKVFATSPTMPVFDENGEYATDWYGGSKSESPMASLLAIKNRLTGSQLLGNLSLEYDLSRYITLKTMLGVNLLDRNNEEYFPRESTYIGGLLGGLGVISDMRITNILNENTVRFARNFNDLHDFEALAGFTWQTEQGRNASMQATGFPHDRFGMDNVAGTSGIPVIASSVQEWQLASFLGRVNYQFNKKYLLTASFRTDGSSKFGAGNKWGYFPSVAAGWRLSEEPFLQNVNWLDDLKLRASYGMTGNQEIGNYQSLARLVTSNIYIVGGQIVSGASQISLANPELRWEKAGQWDIGLDVSLFGSRFNFVFDVYRKNTQDLLFTINLPAYSGYSTALYNTGNVMNTGFELGLDGNILRGPFTWSLQANYSRNRTEIVSLGRSASTSLFVGYPPNVTRGYLYDGVFRDQAEVDAQTAQIGVKPGDARYRDVNGDGQLDADDRVILGDPIPDYFFGFNNQFSYKGFTLGINVQGEIGMNELIDIDSFNPSSSTSNKVRSLMNRWTSDNPDADIPRANVGNWLSNSSFSLADLSYVKIRNIQFGYELPASRIRGLSRIHLYLSGQNLFTFTDYPGYDPDGGRHYPTPKTIILGLNIGL